MPKAIPDLHDDPFGEHSVLPLRRSLWLLGARVDFETDSHPLMQLVDTAYAGLPRHRLSATLPHLRVVLRVGEEQPRRRTEPEVLRMLSSGSVLAVATASSDCVVLAPGERAALVIVSPKMLRFPYHARYELLEFAVFTLAARVQKLISLHAACVGLGGRGLLLMGPSGAGKSTVALQCLLRGFGFVSEDSTFVSPRGMLATGLANFLHVRPDSLRWVDRRNAAAIRNSPVIRRRSGVRKYELDLRAGSYRLASRAQPLHSLIFLSPEKAAERLLRPLSRRDLSVRLNIAQAYAARQPGWSEFCRQALRVGGYELRRGDQPAQAVEALQALLRG